MIDSVIIGKMLVFIGMLEKMICVEVKVWVEVFGVYVVGLVLVKMDLLIVGLGVGFKVKKVVDLGIKVIFEDEWLVIV